MNDHELARHLAQRAGDLLMGIRTGSDHETPEELAGLADVSSHDLLMTLLGEHRPLDAVLSEEGADDQTRLNAERVWIIDPLDGTYHYSMGDDDFAIHVALWERGKGVTAACVFVPSKSHIMSMDDGVTDLAIPSKIRVVVSPTRPPKNLEMLLEQLTTSTGLPTEIVKCGSVGAKLQRMIAGYADVYINTDGFYEWDVAAPLGVATHYGFTVCDTAGNHLELNKANNRVENAVFCHPEFVQAVIKSLA